MGNVHLVTGFAGKSHVTAADHASLFEAAFRSGQFVMNSGNNFKASLISANQVRISDGEMIMQGRFVRINPSAYEDVAIENGAQGYLRNDLIVMRYTRDADTGIESIGLVSIKGQAVAADPADPHHQVGDINDGGSLINDFPLYRIPLDGLNVGDPVALFTLQPSIYDLYTAYKAATDKSLSQLSAEKAPGVESNDYPGCYYRTVGGVVEWLNPPMVLGEEYRTTERWQGKAVYTKLVNCGAFPAAGAAVHYGIGYDITKILRVNGIPVTQSFTVPYVSTDAFITVSGTVYGGRAYIVVYLDRGEIAEDECIVQAWYIKD